MRSNQNINVSVENCIKEKCRKIAYIDRIYLNQQKFEEWLYKTNLNYYEVAYCLGINTKQLISMLRRRSSFSEKLINKLTYLMGARAMFFVIYFPTQKERKRVFLETFGYDLYDRETTRGHKRIKWAK